MGLQLLADELSKIGLQDDEMMENLHETKSACDTAINTLNELLMYDKIDDNMLVLEYSKFSGRLLIENATKPFLVQVNENFKAFDYSLLPYSIAL